MNLRIVAVGFPQGRGVPECGLCQGKRYHFTGTLLALGALSAGVRDRALVAFGCVSILGTAAFGTTLSLVIGRRIAGIDVARHHSP